MDGEQRRGSGGARTPASPSLTKRRGSRKRLKPSLIRIDYLPLVQDEPPRRQHPHTAYAEWDRILWQNGIFRPTKHLGLEEEARAGVSRWRSQGTGGLVSATKPKSNCCSIY